MYIIPFIGTWFYVGITVLLLVAMAVYGIVLGFRSVTRAKRPEWTQIKPEPVQERRGPVFRDETIHHDPRTGEIRGGHHLTAIIEGSKV